MVLKRRSKKKNTAPENSSQQTVNPYTNARRSWNDHMGAIAASRQTWQIVGVFLLLITFSTVGGLIHVAKQSKFVPYVVEVDELGQTAAVAPARKAKPVDQKVIRSYVASFIQNIRLVTPDKALQTKAIHQCYAMLSVNDPAIKKANEWFNGSEDSDPFKKAENKTVEISIESVLPQTRQTWQVDWVETERDRSGVLLHEPVRMRALLTVYIEPPDKDTKEEQIRKNPLGVYVQDFSWSKQL